MEQDQNTNTPPVEQNSPFPAPKNTNKISLIVGGIVVILALFVLGYYLMQSSQAPENIPQTEGVSNSETTAEAPAVDTATAALEVQGTSDEVSAIDADLQATDLSSLGDVDNI